MKIYNYLKLLIVILFLWQQPVIGQHIVLQSGASLKGINEVQMVVMGDNAAINRKGNATFNLTDNSRLIVSMLTLNANSLPEDLSNAILVLRGSSNQAMSGNYTCRELVMDKPAGNLNITDGSLFILEEMNFLGGKIVTGTSAQLLANENLNWIGVSPDNYVVNSLTYRSNVGNGQKAFFYPVGDLQVYHPFSMNFSTSISTGVDYKVNVQQTLTTPLENSNIIAKVSTKAYYEVSSTEDGTEVLSNPSVTLRLTPEDEIDPDHAAVVYGETNEWISLGGLLNGAPDNLSITSEESFGHFGVFGVAEVLNEAIDYNVDIPTLIDFEGSGEASISFSNVAQIDQSTVKYFYKSLRDDDFTELNLQSSNSVFSSTIDDDQLKQIGLSSYFTFQNEDGQLVRTSEKRTYERFDEGDLKLPVNRFGATVSSYQMVSFPLELDNSTVGGVFNDDIGNPDPFVWRIWHTNPSATEGFNDEELSSGSTLERSSGYWLIIKDQAEIDINEGETTLNNNQLISITLQPGLNQIGNPYLFNVSWEDVLNYNGICENVELMGYRNSTVGNLSSLQPFEGAIIRSDALMTLEIPTTSGIPTPPDCRFARWPNNNSIDEESWWVNLKVNNPQMSNHLGGFGMHPMASAGDDSFDQRVFPRLAGFIETTFDSNQRITRDVVPTAEAHTWSFQINSNLESTYTTLEWDNSSFGKNNKTLLLYDEYNEVVIDMREQNTYPVNLNKTGKFQIIFGNQTDVIESLVPQKTVIGSAYPNPVNRVVNIPFSIPDSSELSQVNIDLYDMTGRKVKTITDARYEPGFYEIEVELSGIDRNYTSNQLLVLKSTITQDGKSIHRMEKIIMR